VLHSFGRTFDSIATDCKINCTNMRSVRASTQTAEHMFSSPNKRRQGTITVHPALRRAAGLARAFILLEDLELSGPRTPHGEPPHPHRVPLRSLGGARRPGAGVQRGQRCLSPVLSPAHLDQRVARCAVAPVRVVQCTNAHASR